MSRRTDVILKTKEHGIKIIYWQMSSNFPKGDGGLPRRDLDLGKDSRKGYSKYHLCALTK